jgi:Signal transduction histidine kinase
LVGVFKDLTQIRDLEEEMRRKDWLASLGEMSAGMAHEIRNPLGALAGAMQMLRKDAMEDETNRRLMDIAIREATRLDNIITEFLQYARPPALNLAERDLNKVLAETLDLVQHEARTRSKIKIVTSLATGALTALVDQDQFRQVFWNMATNALKRCRRGTVDNLDEAAAMWMPAAARATLLKLRFKTPGKVFRNRTSIRSFFHFLRRRRKARGWVLLPFIASSICMEAGLRSKVRSVKAQGLSYVCRVPGIPGCGYGMRDGRRGKDPSCR